MSNITIAKTEQSLLGYHYELVERSPSDYIVVTYKDGKMNDFTDSYSRYKLCKERFDRMRTTLEIIFFRVV